MSSSNSNNSVDPFERIYFQDFLKNGKIKHSNVKSFMLFLLCHAGIIGIGVGGYILMDKGIFPDLSIKSTSVEESNVKIEESYSLLISKSSITLNLDEDETTTIEVSIDNPEKSFNLSYDYSKAISMEEVSNSNGTITYKLIPQTIGSGYIEFKLMDIDDNSVIYDTERINLTVEGTLDHGTFNNHLYQTFDVSMSWTEAKSACEEAGGHLATITSEEEQAFIQKLIKSTKKDNLWLGGFYSTSNGSWMWVDNFEWSYTNWDLSQPDNYTGDEYYLRIKNRDRIYNDWGAYDGMWNDTADNADGSDENSDAPISSFGYVCEWDYIETMIIGNLKPTNDVGYSASSDVADCFGNNFTAEEAFSITFSGVNQSRVEFNFDGIDYRTFDYDVSIASSSRDKFVNAEDYSFDADFTLCDMTLVAIQSDGTETNCSGTWDMLDYGFFSETSTIHHTVILPEGTVAIRFEGNAMQSYAGVKVIIADPKLTTQVFE